MGAKSRAEERGSRRPPGARHRRLSILAALWLAYTAWSAGRTLAGQPLTSPLIAQWIAVAAGPLALMGLVWLMFGRTRRKEAERFTRSVIAMRAESAVARSAARSAVAADPATAGSELTMISQHLMQLGDEATGKLGGITREFDSSSEKLRRHGEALDRAAEAARNDIARAARRSAAGRANRARSLPSSCARSAPNRPTRPRSSANRSANSRERTQEADQLVAEATDRLAARLAEIESAGRSSGRPRRRGGSRLLRRARCAARADLGDARRNPDRESTSSRARSPRWSSRLRPASARPAPKRRNRSPPTSTMPTRSLEGTVEPCRRAGTRVAADDRRDRPRPGTDRPALHRARGERRRARQPLPRIADPRARRARHAGRAGELAGRRDRLARRAHRRAAREHRPADRRNPRRRRHCDRRSPGRRRPAAPKRPQRVRPEIGWMRDAAVEAGERLSATGDADRRAAGPLRGAARQCRRRRRRCPVEADRARFDAGAGRARGDEPQRRDRPGAGRRPGAGQGSRGARRRARPRSDRDGHPGSRRQAVRAKTARRSSA